MEWDRLDSISLATCNNHLTRAGARDVPCVTCPQSAKAARGKTQENRPEKIYRTRGRAVDPSGLQPSARVSTNAPRNTFDKSMALWHYCHIGIKVKRPGSARRLCCLEFFATRRNTLSSRPARASTCGAAKIENRHSTIPSSVSWGGRDVRRAPATQRGFSW